MGEYSIGESRKESVETVNGKLLQGRIDHTRTYARAYLRKPKKNIYIYKFISDKLLQLNNEIGWFERVHLTTLMRFYKMNYRIKTSRIVKTLFSSMAKFKTQVLRFTLLSVSTTTKSKNIIDQNPPIATHRLDLLNALECPQKYLTLA